jgi:succinyl-CoA synthetase beta subunit
MNLHEYQAKKLLVDYGIPIPQGFVAFSPEEARLAAQQIPGKRLVVKAQIHAGVRGKAGGVKLVDSLDAVEDAAKSLLGKRLVTYQTDSHGQPVSAVLVEEVSAISHELYLSAVVDRARKRVVFMASSEGGVDIEEVASQHPEKIFYTVIDPLVSYLPYQGRELGFKLGFDHENIQSLAKIMGKMTALFLEKDLSLLEINPLVLAQDGKIICLDAKINVDDNALYRHPEVAAMRDVSQEDDRERRAREHDLNYVALDGNIGCMVNGAGLAMATMVIIKLSGGEPANFLDVGGSATKERVTEAFKIILSDPKVQGILVNIFGGIVRCDLIAEGIIAAVQEVKVSVPVVVRLEGNHAKEGLDLLEKSGFNLIAAENLADAAKKIVENVKV